MRLKDRVVVITGASRGVGAACAEICAREGASLVLAAKTVAPDPRLPGTLHETADVCAKYGAQVEIVPFDARDAGQCEGLIDSCIARFGRIDVLINNAGAIFWSPVADWPLKKFDLVHGVNVRASYVLSKSAIPHMRRQGYGHILMMSPPIHLAAAPGKAPYLLSKVGMSVLGMAIDAEEKEAGIAAHALWPVTGIRTAATLNLAMGDEGQWRTPEILADATLELITRDPRTSQFRTWLDEEVLAETGVSDFRKYRCDPQQEPSLLSIELIDPSWAERQTTPYQR